MWQYNNVYFIYSNEVGSVHGEKGYAPKILTYIKSKYALMEALRGFVEESYSCGIYTEINPRSVKHDRPIKV
jgi:hypothetical protein